MSGLKRHIVDVPDFPRPGIIFRDIAPLLRHQFEAALDALESLFSEREWQQVEALAGIEARGFVPIRKQGKLPPPVVDVPYALEYGTGVLEMQPGNGRLFLIDDVFATGGTMRAAGELCAGAGYEVIGLAALIDLRLAGDFHWREQPLRAVLRYD